MLRLDFETRSRVDLFEEGIYRYAQDPSTEVLMLGYKLPGEDTRVWCPLEGTPFPTPLVDYLVDSDGLVSAFNAEFERLIWEFVLINDFGTPTIALERWVCTAAQARASGCPASLADCAKFLGLPQVKNTEGKRLIKEYSIIDGPKYKGDLVVGSEDLELFKEYCATDVDVEEAVAMCTRELTPTELQDYHINCKINDRGIPLHMGLVQEGVAYGRELQAQANAEIVKLTDGVVEKSTQRKTRDAWLQERLPEAALAVITPADKIVFDKDHRALLRNHPDTPDTVKAFVDAVDEAGGATIGKYSAFAKREIDCRGHGALIFNGAGQTGRYSSTGMQLHNMRRDAISDPRPIIQDLLDGYEIDNPADTLGRLIRACVFHHKGLTWWDWSAIELVVLAWASDSDGGDARVQAYADGADQYVLTAAAMFNVSEEEAAGELRQSGKVMELAGGFGGGKGAVMQFAAVYNLDVDEDGAQDLVNRWRRANPWAVALWTETENAAAGAVRNPGKVFPAGVVNYCYDGHSWLYCELPSKRLIAYFKPKFEEEVGPFGPRLTLTYQPGSVKPKAGQPWPRRSLNRTILVENFTQAIANDFLREALRRTEAAGVPVVLHVHDEIVAMGDVRSTLQPLMDELPAWADGMALRSDGSFGQHYGK